MTIGGSTRRSRQSTVGFVVPIIGVPLVILIAMFSRCDVRERAAKHACKVGDVQACLQVAKDYEAKSEGGGILNFAMSHSDTATAYYFLACKHASASGCDGMMKMNRDSNSVRTTTSTTDIADALIPACADDVDHACKNLELFMSEGDWVAVRGALAFKASCESGNARACYLVARMASANQGGLRNTFAEVLPAYDKACAAQIKDSCAQAKSYRDEQVKRETAGAGAPATH